jgi:hypothetical protein
MLAGSEVLLNLSTVGENWIVRHGATAFLTFVGGRAFQEAVGSCVWKWKESLTGLEDRVKERNGSDCDYADDL